MELVGQLLTSNGLITEDELDGFNGAPCKYLKNSSLLEQIDLTDASVVHTLSTSLQQSDIENNKVIGEALLKCECHNLIYILVYRLSCGIVQVFL